MTQQELKKIFVEEIEKYTSTNNILDKENKTENAFIARKLYYSMLHIMKTNSNIPYSKFNITDKYGMMNSWDYSKHHKEFRPKIIEIADIISERIKNGYK